MWAHTDWVGSFYRSDARRHDFLGQYSTVFNAVEGNSTFYGLPSEEAVARWVVEAPAHFRFCFKFPRAVSHDRRLVGVEDDVGEFLQRLAPLGERLGPMLVQLPAAFGPTRLGVLDSFLSKLPRRLRYAVEVRHRAFFSNGPEEHDLDSLLRAREVDRVLFGTTELFAAGTAGSGSFAEVLRKKPCVPLRRTATGPSPVVRFVGNPDTEKSRGAIRGWATAFDSWMTAGLTPYFFAHHANDTLSPRVARMFHEEMVALRPDLGRLPEWPCERERAGVDSDDPSGQMTLFG